MDEELFWIYCLAERREKTFGGADGLCLCRFESDAGTVSQIREAYNYVRYWKSMQETGLGLLFWGRSGNGKTFAAACIANALIEDRGPFPNKVRMATFGTILTKLLALSPEDKQRYLEDLIGCDLLILDDFGMERQTEFAREQVFQIVDGRYVARRPLIVTTNLSLTELKNPKDIQQQRIFDRVLEMCVPVCFDGQSLRRDRAKENLQRYRQLTGAG